MQHLVIIPVKCHWKLVRFRFLLRYFLVNVLLGFVDNLKFLVKSLKLAASTSISIGFSLAVASGRFHLVIWYEIKLIQ